MSAAVATAKSFASKPGLEETVAPKQHHIRITLTSRHVSRLEAVCRRIIDTAKSADVKAKGPIRIPTKVLRITTRKTPCGEGSKTWDRYELRIHKRVIDLQTTPEMVKQITNVQIESGVEVEVTMASA